MILMIIGMFTVAAVAVFAVIVLIYAIRAHIDWHNYVDTTLEWLVKKAKEGEERSDDGSKTD